MELASDFYQEELGSRLLLIPLNFFGHIIKLGVILLLIVRLQDKHFYRKMSQ